MDRPIQLVVSVLGLFVLAGRGLSADESASNAKRERAISSRVAELLSAASPRFESIAPTTSETETAAPGEASSARPRLPATERTAPANTIIRLPEYIVRERKPWLAPKEEDVMVPRELEKLAMREFLGPEDGFDRGFLNLFTLPQLWKKIPLLGKIPMVGFETNEERAMRMYRADRNAKKWSEAMSLLTAEERAAIATPTGSAPPRK